MEGRRRHHPVGRSAVGVAAALVALATSAGAAGAAVAPGSEGPRTPVEPYVVVLEEGSEPRGIARRLQVSPGRVYDAALDGFNAFLTPTQVDMLLDDDAVLGVVPDVPSFERQERRFSGVRTLDRTDNAPGQEACYFISCQHVPVNMQRIDAMRSRTADIDWKDDARVDVDIAIIDSGVRDHPDINLVGSAYCGPGRFKGIPDDHGTGVAGVAAMIDDHNGLVGSAPGARIWSVQVTNTANGSITLSSVLCAVDWVAANSSVIEVANMSLGAATSEMGNCGVTENGRVADALHYAICGAVDAGVTFTVAAGNDSMDASNQIPAAYDEVITVSAYVDYDGEPGGKFPTSECYWVFFGDEEDDTFAYWSNYGLDVDITAPGDCVLTSYGAQEVRFRVVSGTSFAAPAVAGAAALIYARDPLVSPLEVKRRLITAAEPVSMPDDPDGVNEPLLNLRGL